MADDVMDQIIRVFFYKTSHWDNFDIGLKWRRITKSNLPRIDDQCYVVAYGLAKKIKDVRKMSHLEFTKYVHSVPFGKVCALEVIKNPSSPELYRNQKLPVSHLKIVYY